jgi:pimeloyl-ACP methyl ester carboxylesterase
MPEVSEGPSSLQRVSFSIGETEVEGILHLPEAGNAGRAAVLHGFGGDPHQPHVVAVCEALAMVGIGALRSAFRDHRPPRMTLDSALADAQGALRLLRAHPALRGPSALVGFSFGGAVAALAAGRDRAVKAVVLAAAPARFSRGADDAKRDPVAELSRSRAKVLLVWGTSDTEVPFDHAERYRAAVARAEVVRIDGGDHDFAPAAPRAEMARIVADWLAGAL